MILIGTLLSLMASEACSEREPKAEEDYKQAIQSGRSLDWVKDFDRLYPKALHSISYYTGEFGKPVWNSKAGLYGRYVLVAEMDIEFNESRTKIVKHSKPRFYLSEIARITKDPETGQVVIENGKLDVEFGLKDWRKVVKKSGDFSAIAVKLIKNKPVELFDRYWKDA